MYTEKLVSLITLLSSSRSSIKSHLGECVEILDKCCSLSICLTVVRTNTSANFVESEETDFQYFVKNVLTEVGIFIKFYGGRNMFEVFFDSNIFCGKMEVEKRKLMSRIDHSKEYLNRLAKSSEFKMLGDLATILMSTSRPSSIYTKGVVCEFIIDFFLKSR